MHRILKTLYFQKYNNIQINNLQTVVIFKKQFNLIQNCKDLFNNKN